MLSNFFFSGWANILSPYTHVPYTKKELVNEYIYIVMAEIGIELELNLIVNAPPFFKTACVHEFPWIMIAIS